MVVAWFFWLFPGQEEKVLGTLIGGLIGEAMRRLARAADTRVRGTRKRNPRRGKRPQVEQPAPVVLATGKLRGFEREGKNLGTGRELPTSVTGANFYQTANVERGKDRRQAGALHDQLLLPY